VDKMAPSAEPVLKPNSDEMLLQFVIQGDDHAQTEREFSVVGTKLQPLSYSDLVNLRLGSNVTVPLNFENAKIISSSIPEIGVDKFASVSVSARLSSTYTSRTIGLVKGGWLPSGLAHQAGMVVLPDRCTVTELKARFRNGLKKKDDNDFLDLFADKEVAINPALYALEGNMRLPPTEQVIAQQLDEAYTAIKTALPKATLVPSDKESLKGIIGIGQDTHDSMMRKQRFLMKLAPKTHAPVAASKQEALWSEIATTANDCGVPTASLVVLAVLSTIVVPNGRSPAKRLLKLKANYTEQDAYNALADLRSLEVLMCLFAIYPQNELMLCTGDRDLALFWAAVRASNFRWTDGHASFDLSPVEELLPGRLSDFVELSRSGTRQPHKLTQLAASIRRV